MTQSVDGVVPESGGGVVRMTAGIAGQLVTPGEDNTCKIVQIANGDPKGWIPSSIIKYAQVRDFPIIASCKNYHYFHFSPC